jgi:hypothetical protein
MRNKIKILIVALIILIVILAAALIYFIKFSNQEKATTQNSTTKTQITPKETGNKETAVEDIDQIIKKSVMSAAAPSITDVIIIDKKSYTDTQNTTWIRFNVAPVPEGATDPAYGVMKKEAGKSWKMVDFGTCCIEDNLPTDVKQGLGFE